MHPYLFTELVCKWPKMSIAQFLRNRKYGLAADESKTGDSLSVECAKELKLTIKRNIRNSNSLRLRNCVWLVAAQPVREALLGLPLLGRMGLDTKAALAAACDKYADDIDLDFMEETRDYR